MQHGRRDWLEVVYGAGLDLEWDRRGTRAEIRVRAAPNLERLTPGEEHRIRVTVSPTDPGLWWRLYLRDFGPDPREGRRSRVWWRAYPGTWQPLGGTRQCLAEGRGRVRVDVSLRLEPDGDERSAPPSQLRFVAEAA
jgi:hypothetical protein